MLDLEQDNQADVRTVAQTSRAVTVILEHSVRVGLPLPDHIDIEIGDRPHFAFDDRADLAAWSTYVEVPISGEPTAEFAGVFLREYVDADVLDQPVRFWHIGGGRS